MISARRFIKQDLEQLNRWHALYEMPLLRYEDLPAIGYIVPGVCAGFLYQTDSSLCMLDAFIANPEARGNARREALNSVTELLLTTAKDLCFTTVLAFTQHESIKSRCERYEFTDRGAYNLFSRRF